MTLLFSNDEKIREILHDENYDGEYSTITIKDQYEVLPKISYPMITIEEIIETEKKVTVKVTPKVTVNQQKILEAIKENPFITQDELSQIIGLSRKSIIQNMKKLQENGLIKRVGADKNGRWEVEEMPHGFVRS